MKKFKLKKQSNILTVIAISTLAFNMLFLPPFIAEEPLIIDNECDLEFSRKKKKSYGD